MTENKRFTRKYIHGWQTDAFLNVMNGLDEKNKKLKKENEKLKSKLECANGEISHCHMIINTLVENEGVTDYNDLLNKCDKEILKDMGWENV